LNLIVEIAAFVFSGWIDSKIRLNNSLITLFSTRVSWSSGKKNGATEVRIGSRKVWPKT
jgi:hypothetical protein